ncbi:MAG TPA: FtsL-like putative cell division protein [Bacteroidales bacterium]|nr:FtsL-like putative cell division protein [Bacteroidales bacterium]HQG55636.1 FtsL-like putative cell division protein [Bacteroidales bacterium]HQK69616.1 FtsL-like putative cell division protein [Bacteroidales bacterium]
MEEKAQDNMEGKKKKNSGSFLKDLLSGSTISDKIILKNLRFLIFLTFLGALYIANRFHAEKLVREMSQLQKEVRELRAESLATSAELMKATRQSEILRQVTQRGLELEELREPPYKLVK